MNDRAKVIGLDALPTFLILVVLLGAGYFVFHSLKPGQPIIEPPPSVNFGPWQGGTVQIDTTTNAFGDDKNAFQVNWIKGKKTIHLSPFLDESPTLKITKDGALAMIFRADDQFTLQIRKAPREPAEQIAHGSREEVHAKLID